MASIPILGDFNTTFSADENCQTLINWYLVNDQEGKTAQALFPLPGLTLFAQIPGKQVRGLYENIGVTYAVVDDGFYIVNDDGSYAQATGRLASVTGQVQFISNESGTAPTQIMVSDMVTGYVYTISTNTIAQITDPQFVGSGTLTFINGFAVFNKPSANQWQVSDAEDFTSYDATQVAAVTSISENIQCVKAHKLELYLLTNKGGEVWVAALTSSPGNTFPFQRREDTFITQGIDAPLSMLSIDNTLYWLAKTSYSRGIAVYAYYDTTQQKISNEAIETVFQSYEVHQDAIAYGFAWNGHLFYVLTFPSEDVTWVYDIATKAWFQWSTAGGRHLSNCYCLGYGKNLVGDYQSGNIYYLDQENFTDNGTTIIRERTSRHGFFDNKWVSIYNFQINFETGVGLQVGQGSNPQCMLQISRDGGHTFGPELWRPIGKVGQYGWRAVWMTLGMARDWVFRIRVSDPVKFVIVGATGDIEVGDS